MLSGRTSLIPLSQGLSAIVDAIDVELILGQGKWSSSVRGDVTYGERKYRDSSGRRKTIYLHQFLTGFVETDHHNGNGLDNRRSNLRLATHQQNCCNKAKQVNNSSGYIGVSWHRQGRWYAQIQADGRKISVGYFADKVSAAVARDKAAIHHHGEFARLNFPTKENA